MYDIPGERYENKKKIVCFNIIIILFLFVQMYIILCML